MKTYNLRLVRHWLSVGVFIFTCLVFLFLTIFVAAISGDLLKSVILLYILLVMGTFIYILWKYYDKLLVKYSRILKITEEYFEFDNRKYKWEDVDWHRTDDNSAIMNGFVVGLKDSSTLKFHVTKKKNEELENWQNMKEEFLQVLLLKNIHVRNYYNSIFWRRTARIMLVSNIVIPVILLQFQISFLKVLPVLLFWFGITLTLSITIFNNQKTKDKKVESS